MRTRPNSGHCRPDELKKRKSMKAKREISTGTLLESLKKLWKMRVTLIIIITGALATIPKGG